MSKRALPSFAALKPNYPVNTDSRKVQQEISRQGADYELATPEFWQ